MAAAAGSYKRILQVLEKWPIQETKVGRDLGEFLRSKVNQAYKENKFETNFSYWDNQYLSLNRLVNNEHQNKYKRTHNSSATGFTAEQCNIALSNDMLEQLKEEDSSFFKKLFSSIKS